MKLIHLLQAYSFDELMPVINEMFPGTSKFRKPLQKAYDILTDMRPVMSNKSIVYKITHDEKSGESYMGADDVCFNSTWEVVIGKEVVRERGVDLNDAEITANCLVNLCLLSRYPKCFEPYHQELLK